MSLELANYINDFIVTNPEGTDPKSQGDDHLRMIKQVLKNQFSGFTDEIAITLKETQLNAAIIGLAGALDGARNIDAPIGRTFFFGFNLGMTGTAPPGADVGDMILNVAYDGGSVYQIQWVRTTNLIFWRRYFLGAWATWQCLSPIGSGQSWQNLVASRVLGTTYTNTTGRPIMVSVAASGNNGLFATLEALVSGVSVAIETITDVTPAGNSPRLGTVQFVVPYNATYGVSVSAASTLSRWAELR